MEKEQENSYHKINLNCEKPIYIKPTSNHCKYSLFDNEIFTFLFKMTINKEKLVK